MSWKNRTSTKALVLSLSLLLSQWSFATPYESRVQEDPTALAMATDLVFVRPVMFTITVVGSAVWLVGLPFSAAGGNIKGSANTLIVQPGKNTFVRCLGCTKAGYTKDVMVD